jgi:hypothetical protein
MTNSREDNIRRVVKEMFQWSNPPAGQDKIDNDGAPLRLKRVVSDYFAPDIRITVPGHGPQAFVGGADEYYQHHIKRLGGRQDNLKYELLDTVVGKSYAAGVLRYSDNINGKTFSWLRMNVYKFNDEGTRVVEILIFEHDQHGVDSWYGSYMSG